MRGPTARSGCDGRGCASCGYCSGSGRLCRLGSRELPALLLCSPLGLLRAWRRRSAASTSARRVDGEERRERGIRASAARRRDRAHRAGLGHRRVTASAHEEGRRGLCRLACTCLAGVLCRLGNSRNDDLDVVLALVTLLVTVLLVRHLGEDARGASRKRRHGLTQRRILLLLLFFVLLFIVIVALVVVGKACICRGKDGKHSCRFRVSGPLALGGDGSKIIRDARGFGCSSSFDGRDLGCLFVCDTLDFSSSRDFDRRYACRLLVRNAFGLGSSSRDASSLLVGNAFGLGCSSCFNGRDASSLLVRDAFGLGSCSSFDGCYASSLVVCNALSLRSSRCFDSLNAGNLGSGLSGGGSLDLC